MSEFWQQIIINLSAALVGSIVVYVRKLFKDLNASFTMVRSMEARVSKLEKELSDGEGENS